MLILTPSSTSLFHRLPFAVFCHVTNSHHPFVAVATAARNPTRRNNNNNDVSKPTKQLLRAKQSVKEYSKLSPVPSLNNKSELSESQSLVQMFPEVGNRSTVRLPTTCLVKSAPPRIAASQSRSCAMFKSPNVFGSAKNVSKAFGLKSTSFKVCAMAVYKVKLIGPDGEENEFEAPDDTYDLDAAENAGLELPYSCRAGACSTCARQIATGTVDQSDGSFLDEKQVEKRYLRTCVSYPTSDCVIHTHKEGDLY